MRFGSLALSDVAFKLWGFGATYHITSKISILVTIVLTRILLNITTLNIKIHRILVSNLTTLNIKLLKFIDFFISP